MEKVQETGIMCVELPNCNVQIGNYTHPPTHTHTQ